MKTITYHIPAISCSHCIHTIKTELLQLVGVNSVDADLGRKEIIVHYAEPASPEKIEGLLKDINYPPSNG